MEIKIIQPQYAPEQTKMYIGRKGEQLKLVDHINSGLVGGQRKRCCMEFGSFIADNLNHGKTVKEIYNMLFPKKAVANPNVKKPVVLFYRFESFDSHKLFNSYEDASEWCKLERKPFDKVTGKDKDNNLIYTLTTPKFEVQRVKSLY